jgi:hypothetical protein
VPRQFDKFGISFQYPDNWVLDRNDAKAEQPTVTVFTPGGGFWSVSVHPRGTNPLRLARTAVKAMREEYEGVESVSARETIAGRELRGYDLSFFYLDLTNTAAVRCLRTERATYTFFYQAEDREFERVGQVFLAMTTSMLKNVEA